MRSLGDIALSAVRMVARAGTRTGDMLSRFALGLATARSQTRQLVATVVVIAMIVAGIVIAGLAPAGAAAGRPGGHHAARTSAPRADETTASDNDLRNGWDPDEPGLTPAVVGSPAFGQVFSTALKGQIYAQPLVVGSTVIVATEQDWVYGLDAATGAVEWSTSLGTPYPITTCPDLAPDVGVTSTPVYDPSTGTVYVMAMVKETGYQFHLFGLDATTGAITLKKRIAGSPSNDSHITFRAVPQDQRTGLLLLNGWVYAAFASHCDHNPYAGYVAGVDVAQRPLTTTLWTDEAGVSDDQAGIWQSGGGLVSDGPGRIIFTSGNGISPAPGAGDKPPGQLAESVVRLTVNTDGSLAAKDFFSPANAPSLDAGDVDFGAGGPVVLPFGTAAYPGLLAQAGKDGRIFLLNDNNLGGREQGPAKGDADLALAGPYGGQWNHPAAFGDTATLTPGDANSANDYMVYVGHNDYMREFKVGDAASDTPTLTDVANTSFTLGYTSGAPVITSNGTDPTSSVIWDVDASGGSGTGSQLVAWDLLPQPKASGGVKLKELFGAPIGTAAKFSTVATANGMVYVGTRDGNVIGFGATGGGALRRGATATFADTAVGSASHARVSVTAARRVVVTGTSVTSMNTPDPYTVGRVTLTHPNGTTGPATFPVTLAKGDTLHAWVSFSPAAAGGAPGAITFTTGSGAGRSIPLIGDGTRTGLFATPGSLSYFISTNDGLKISNVPVGVSRPEVTDIVNGGDTAVTVTSVTPPAAPYVARGLPRAGTVIEPGEALPVQVTFAPRGVVPSSGSFTVTVSTGTSVTVTLNGTGKRPVTRFTATPGTVNFGSVPVGQTATVYVRVANTGNQPSLMRRSALPGGPFGEPSRVTGGLPVNGGDDLDLPVTFHPVKAGAFSGIYKLSWTDRSGEHTLDVPVSGTGVG